ncbi:SphA family protein [Pelagicoccus mobilis]|uniref:Transporter n=1 Tax=Pelagicoccus mobilis TaxID=415221 RepID=A0A934VSP8_9BACT|nr:transporter [Pelagicoccus mobilis]MBK1880642.1 transporter [Pelagicoccus mobilis]
MKLKQLASLGLLIAAPLSLHAAEGGYSNYVPGFYGDLGVALEPAEGWSMRTDAYFYRADGEQNVRSGELEVSADLELSLAYFSLINKPGIELFGAQYAFGGTLVAGKADIEAELTAGETSLRVADDKTSYGDITLVPGSFYWNNGSNWHFNQAFYVVAPVGDYDVNDVANIGLNYWTFETDFSATYMNEEKGQDYSFILGYGYNTENDDTDYQSGDEIHLDFVLNQFVSPTLALGVHGYFFKQLSGDSGAGAQLGDFKAEAAGVGPAVMWVPEKFGGEAAFVAKWIHEYDSENRMDGDHVFLSFMKSF